MPASANVIRYDFGQTVRYENGSCSRTFHEGWRHFLLATFSSEAFTASGMSKRQRDHGWRATVREAKCGHVAVLISTFRVPVARRRAVVVGADQHGFG